MPSHTFLWHDYETFGATPRRDRPAQFAAIRTDADLNPVGEPMVWYCQPAADRLPDPVSCLITGITPQLCQQRGLPEHQFAQHIHRELSRPGTIGVGYNSIRFDDEFTRFLFWRNLIDPYGREWQNGCGRWDLLDVMRLAYALRPDGLVWPQHADGRPSFRLEDLARANGIAHESAHDALSDVQATIGLARRLRQAQPRLFDFAFRLHRKDAVLKELGLPGSPDTLRPFIHVSGFYPAAQGCMALMWPLATHPRHRNELLAWNLAHDPSVLQTLSAQALCDQLTAPAHQGERLPISRIALNRSPMVMGHLGVLTPERAQHWGLSIETAGRHAAQARALGELGGLWSEVFDRMPPMPRHTDPEEDLYGAFVSTEDRRRLDILREQELSDGVMGDVCREVHFDDARLSELVFRYRARMAPDRLDPVDQARWQQHCHMRLLGEQGEVLQAWHERIDALAQTASEQGDERAEGLLEALYDHVERLTADW